MAQHGISSSSKPVVLAFENSTMCGSLALICPGLTIAEYSLSTKATHSKRLLAGIDHILRDSNLDWPDLNAIAISLGPGSFTGLRIGLTTAKGLAMATDLPMIGVDSITALANQIQQDNCLICPLIDARKSEVYTALYKRENGKLLQLTKIIAIKPNKLPDYIKESVIFVGDGSVLYKDELIDLFDDLALFAPFELFYPRASSVGSLAVHKFLEKDFLDPIDSGPIYVRKSDAELNFIIA